MFELMIILMLLAFGFYVYFNEKNFQRGKIPFAAKKEIKKSTVSSS